MLMPRHVTAGGTITSIQTEENPQARGQARYPHFRVLIECGNQISAREWSEQLVTIKHVGRHGPRVYILDGKLSTPEEALQVGRMVNIMNDQYIAVSSTVPGPEARAGTRNADSAIYMLKAGSITSKFETYDGKKKHWKEPEESRYEVTVFLDVTAGQISDAFIAGAWGHGRIRRPYQPVDASGLVVKDGTITGELSVTVDPNNQEERLLDDAKSLQHTFTINAVVDEKGTITSAGEKGRAIGRLLKRPDAKPEAGTLWFRFADIPHSRKVGFAVAPLTAGEIGSCTIMYNKGMPLTAFEPTTLTTKDNTVSATLAGTLKVWEKEAPCTIAVEARWFGNRMLIGTYTLTWGDLVITDSLRGGIEADGAPPLVNLVPEIRNAAQSVIDEWKQNKKKKK